MKIKENEFTDEVNEKEKICCISDLDTARDSPLWA